MKNVLYSKCILPGHRAEDGETASILWLTEEVNFLLITITGLEGRCCEAMFLTTQRQEAIETAVDRARKLIEQQEAEFQKKQLCPHDLEPHECEACMIASDHAYDAAREDRIFGR